MKALKVPKSYRANRVDYDDDGNLDDVVLMNVKMFRLERMTKRRIWIACYREGLPEVVIRLNSRSKITGSVDNHKSPKKIPWPKLSW